MLFFVILVIFSVIVILVFVIGEVFVNFQLQCVCALWPFLLVCFADLIVLLLLLLLLLSLEKFFVNSQFQCVCVLWPFLLVCFACFPPPPAAPVNNLIRKQALQ